MFLEGKDYLSIWKVAHQWADKDPESTKPDALPEEEQDNIFRIIQGFMRDDLTLRKKNGARIADDNPFAIFSFISSIVRLRKCLIKHNFDKTYLDSVLVGRGEVLRWCQKEFRTPPNFWMPEEDKLLPTAQPVEANNNEEDEKTAWYDDLTPRRKHRAMCLEIARRLWAENENLKYEQVYDNPIMNRFECKKAFTTLENFKKWSRPFSPSAAKELGRQK